MQQLTCGCVHVQDGIAVLDDLLLDALEGLQVKAQLDNGIKNKAAKPIAMKVQQHAAMTPCKAA